MLFAPAGSWQARKGAVPKFRPSLLKLHWSVLHTKRYLQNVCNFVFWLPCILAVVGSFLLYYFISNILFPEFSLLLSTCSFYQLKLTNKIMFCNLAEQGGKNLPTSIFTRLKMLRSSFCNELEKNSRCGNSQLRVQKILVFYISFSYLPFYTTLFQT